MWPCVWPSTHGINRGSSSLDCRIQNHCWVGRRPPGQTGEGDNRKPESRLENTGEDGRRSQHGEESRAKLQPDQTVGGDGRKSESDWRSRHTGLFFCFHSSSPGFGAPLHGNKNLQKPPTMVTTPHRTQSASFKAPARGETKISIQYKIWSFQGIYSLYRGETDNTIKVTRSLFANSRKKKKKGKRGDQVDSLEILSVVGSSLLWGKKLRPERVLSSQQR